MNFDKNIFVESINTALAESFEGLAFMEFDMWEETKEIPESEDKQYLTSVEISDPFKAKLSLVCSKSFTYNLIESITGEEVEDDSMVSDTLNEILNTFAGRFMVNLLKENAEFDFGIPVFSEYNSAAIKTKDQDFIVKYVYEEELVFCVFNQM